MGRGYIDHSPLQFDGRMGSQLDTPELVLAAFGREGTVPAFRPNRYHLPTWVFCSDCETPPLATLYEANKSMIRCVGTANSKTRDSLVPGFKVRPRRSRFRSRADCR